MWSCLGCVVKEARRSLVMGLLCSWWPRVFTRSNLNEVAFVNASELRNCMSQPA